MFPSWKFQLQCYQPNFCFSNWLFQLHPSLKNNFELVIYFVLEHLIFSLNCGFKSTYGITSRRLKLHMESRGSLWDKILVNFDKTYFRFLWKPQKTFKSTIIASFNFTKLGRLSQSYQLQNSLTVSPISDCQRTNSNSCGSFVRSGPYVDGIQTIIVWIFGDCFTLTEDDYTSQTTIGSHGTRWQCTAKTFYYGVFDAYSLKLTWIMYF